MLYCRDLRCLQASRMAPTQISAQEGPFLTCSYRDIESSSLVPILDSRGCIADFQRSQHPVIDRLRCKYENEQDDNQDVGKI